jgi:hypothetical protein
MTSSVCWSYGVWGPLIGNGAKPDNHRTTLAGGAALLGLPAAAAAQMTHRQLGDRGSRLVTSRTSKLHLLPV